MDYETEKAITAASATIEGVVAVLGDLRDEGAQDARLAACVSALEHARGMLDSTADAI